VPIAALPGYEGDPAFSTDRQTKSPSFGGKDKERIYTVMMTVTRRCALTSKVEMPFRPVHRTAGRVAFYRFSENGAAIYTVPALGGTEQRLRTGSSGRWTAGLGWSPDGRFWAISEGQEDKNRAWIALLSLADSSTRPLTSPSSRECDPPLPSHPTVRGGFVREIVAGVVSRYLLVPVAGGTSKRLTFDKPGLWGRSPGLRTAHEIVFSYNARRSRRSLARAPLPEDNRGGCRRRRGFAWSPAISPKGISLRISIWPSKIAFFD